MAITIRRIAPSDEHAWQNLWRDYMAFYRTSFSEDASWLTFRRILDPSEMIIGFVADRDANLLGFAHAIVSRSTWSAAPTLYLADLFVATGAKRSGIGAKLINAVYAEADAIGASQVWWLTHEANARARGLYDKVAHRSGHVHYARYARGPRPGGENDP